MKKLLLVSAIAAISTTASAYDLVEKDGFTLGVSGEYEIIMRQQIGTNQDLLMHYDDLALDFGANYVINNRISAFANLGFDWNGQGDGTAATDEIDSAYVGLKVGGLTTTVGNQTWATDDFGNDKDIKFSGGTAFGTTSGKDTIKFAYGMGNYGLTLSHDMEEATDESSTDLLVTTKVGRVDLGVAYQDYKASSTAASVDTVGLMASTDIGKANVALDYSSNDASNNTNASVGFPVTSKVGAAVGATYVDGKMGAADVTTWYTNATYSLNSNVSVYAEIGDNDAANSDLGYLAGMKVKF